jgi:hypothetical protein
MPGNRLLVGIADKQFAKQIAATKTAYQVFEA